MKTTLRRYAWLAIQCALAFTSLALTVKVVLPGATAPLVLELPAGSQVTVDSGTNSAPPPVALPELSDAAKAAYNAAQNTVAAYPKEATLRNIGTAFYTCWLAKECDVPTVSAAMQKLAGGEHGAFTALLSGVKPENQCDAAQGIWRAIHDGLRTANQPGVVP